MRTSGAGWALVALLAAGATGAMGFSFDAPPRSIFGGEPVRSAPSPIDVRPLAVQPVTDGTDAASRARSWFDAATGKICLGTEIHRTCR